MIFVVVPKQSHPWILVLASAIVAAGMPPAGVGLLRFTVRDPVGGKPMAAAAFYPARTATGTTAVGPYDVAASGGVAAAPGLFPLVVFSHGSGGSLWDLDDFETGLARRGFVVAAVTHPGDNYADSSGVGTDRVLVGRPLQMSALISAVLANPLLAPHVDPDEIGAAGFSAGGYTVLVMAGARPNFSLLKQYCGQYPHDPIFCKGWHVRITRPNLKIRRDPRVKAVVAMAPLGIYFDRAALAGVRVPVRLFASGLGNVLPLAANAERVRDELPLRPQYTVFPRAQHLVFIAPCTARMAAHVPKLCRDPPGVNRRAIHVQVLRGMAAFFHRTLGGRQR